MEKEKSQLEILVEDFLRIEPTLKQIIFDQLQNLSTYPTT